MYRYIIEKKTLKWLENIPYRCCTFDFQIIINIMNLKRMKE